MSIRRPILKKLSRQATGILTAMGLLVVSATAVNATGSTGALDTSYGNSGLFEATAPSGSDSSTVSIVAGPNETTFHLIQNRAAGQTTTYAITQLDASGDPVPTYGTNGTVTVPVNQSDSDRRVYMMRHLGGGAMMVLGTYQSGGTYLAKFTGTGTFDSSFGTGGESRVETNVSPSNGYDFTVSGNGYIYVWGQGSGQHGRLARFDFSTGAKDTNWGTGLAATNGYIEAPTASNVRIIGFSIENDNSGFASVAVWGTSRVAGSEQAVIGRWVMTAGTSPATTASWGTNNNGYVQLASSVADAKALSYALSGYGTVYMLIGTAGNSTNRSIVAFDKSSGAPVSAFTRATGTGGVVSLSNTANEIQIATTTVNNSDRVYLLGTASQGGAHYTFVDAFDSTGQPIQTFGMNGRTLLDSCPRELNPQAMTVALPAQQNDPKPVVVGGSNTAGYFALKLGAGNYSPSPDCGTTTIPQGGGGGGGGGGNAPSLPTLTGTIEEVAGPGIKLTVPAVASGARLDLIILPSTYTFSPNNADNPVGRLGDADATSVTATSIAWFGPNNTQTRSTRLEVGATYTVSYMQVIFSPRAVSAETTTTITITGKASAPVITTATTIAPVTTVAPAATVVPGVTVTDTKVYTSVAPKKVAAGSAIAVMTPAQAKTRDIETLTPMVCVPANDDLVFIKTGRCIAQVVNEKTGKVLRTLSTRVVADEVSELNVGNEIVTLAPIYFGGASASIDAAAIKRLQSIKDRISAAGTVLLVGHSGILMGNTPENQEMSRARAIATRKELQRMGAKGPFYVTSAGALAPATTKMTSAAQAKNRRVVIVLIP